jgi:hypothetical protein
MKTFLSKYFQTRTRKLWAELSGVLYSRKGKEGQRLFRNRVISAAPLFFNDWDAVSRKRNFSDFPSSVALVTEKILDEHIVDINYPAYRTGGIFQNSFAPVRVLRALARQCTDEEEAWKFLRLLVEHAPGNHCHWAAYAGLLLEAGKLREAADAALEGRRLAEYDYCCSRMVNDTQKALAVNGLEPDLPVGFTDNSDRFCDMPFVSLKYSTSLAGEEHISPTVCFSMAWLPIAFDHDFSWNGEDMRELRRSILDGDFRYCDECRCPDMRDAALPRKADITDPYLRDIIDNRKLVVEKGPRRLHFAYDIVCNISCPSCRPNVRTARPEITEKLDAYMDRELPPLLPGVREITISQSGEALASGHSLRILKSLTPSKYPDLKVELFTNMTLVSPRMWESLGESAGCIKKIFMSVDGATPATLEKLRRGLKWPRLLEALEFVRELRLGGRLEATTLQLVLQKDNFRELRELLDLAATYCLDTVMISKIESHGSYEGKAFHDLNVGDPANPLFSEYKAAVEDAKRHHALMVQNKERLRAEGKSVPNVIWRLF